MAIVTGASSGIGWSTALELARRGCRLALAARRAQALDELVREVKELGATAMAVPTDVTQRHQVEAMVDQVLEQWGRVDLVVANAGAYMRSRVVDLTVESLERSLSINFYGSLYPVLAVLPHMVERGSGHLVLVGSLDGKKALPLDAPYVVAKFAVTALGDVARQELAELGIGVTTVLPGRVDTPLVADLRFPAISPKFPPHTVARAIVRGIRRNRPEVIVPSYYRGLVLLNAVSPRLTNTVISLLHLEGWEESRR